MTFDHDFLDGLKRRDPATCNRFVYHFTPILEAKLRYDFRDHALAEDLRNETMLRVFIQVDKDGVREPERFGAFVRGVCDRVVLEYLRKQNTTCDWPEGFEPPADIVPIDKWLIDEQIRELLLSDLRKISEEDRNLITEIYWRKRERESMARELGITPVGLNVRLCRAIKRLRSVVFARIKTDAAGETRI
jgi:RNA polymerase sigma factor (sigma-70 family)